MSLLDGIWRMTREVARHLLRRPVVGVVAAARSPDGRWLLVRRSDTGDWALPGGTLEWGETLREGLAREIAEETGARVLELGPLVGVFSRPERDPRFHAVTVVVSATVSEPVRPANPIEIREARLFAEHELPARLSHGNDAMLAAAKRGEPTWE
jgi:8-oxo-dGTP diphosphatase